MLLSMIHVPEKCWGMWEVSDASSGLSDCLTRYRPQWEMAQSIRYTVDELESGRVEKRHGLLVNQAGQAA